MNNITSQNVLQQKIKEYKQLCEVRRLAKSFKMPRPYDFPQGGTATFYLNEECPGIGIPEYKITLSNVQPRLHQLQIQSSGVLDPAIPNLWYITQWGLKQKLCYWHAEPPTLFFTYRSIGRIEIIYTQSEWDLFAGDLKLNFAVFSIPTPDSDSSSDDNEQNPESCCTRPGRVAFSQIILIFETSFIVNGTNYHNNVDNNSS